MQNKGLEDKLREPAQAQLGSAEQQPRVTPNALKVWSTTGTMMCGTDPHSLRIINSVNETMSQSCSDLIRGADSLRELIRKRELKSRGGIENNFPVSASSIDRNKSTTALIESNSKGRLSIDPSKALARVTRTTKLTAQRPLTSSRISREQQVTGGVKERDRTSRVWLR